jgi:phosphomannomutase
MENEKFIKIYADFLSRYSQLYQPLKAVFDCSNGTTGMIINRIFQNNRKLKNLLTYKLINQNPDGNFPAHGPDPLKRFAIRDLRSAVIKRKADLGVIFDADGDRVFFIDNRGRLVDPDAIGRLLIWQINPKKVVIDVRAGWLIRKLITHNSKLTTSKVGYFFIKKLMRKIKADLGIERSGHYYFRISDPNLRIASESTNKSELYYDDGILAAIHVINAVSRLPYTLADFTDLLPKHYRSGEISIRYPVSGIRNQEFFKKIERKLISHFSFLISRVSHLDGLTIETRHFWFNLRPSNTEPVIRLNIEAASRETLRKEKKQLTKIIKNIILKIET